MWTVKYDSKTLRVDADFFKYAEKISVFENTRLRVDGDSKIVRVLRQIYEYMKTVTPTDLLYFKTLSKVLKGLQASQLLNFELLLTNTSDHFFLAFRTNKMNGSF